MRSKGDKVEKGEVKPQKTPGLEEGTLSNSTTVTSGNNQFKRKVYAQGFKSHKALDEFIQNSLDKYHFVDPMEEMYEATGVYAKFIVSNKSAIPDLVIWNKKFNKNECFYEASTKEFNAFPRFKFILRAKPPVNPADNSKTGDKENKVLEKKVSNKGLGNIKGGSGSIPKVENPKTNIIAPPISQNIQSKQINTFIKIKQDDPYDDEEVLWEDVDVTEFENTKIKFQALPGAKENKVKDQNEEVLEDEDDDTALQKLMQKNLSINYNENEKEKDINLPQQKEEKPILSVEKLFAKAENLFEEEGVEESSNMNMRNFQNNNFDNALNNEFKNNFSNQFRMNDNFNFNSDSFNNEFNQQNFMRQNIPNNQKMKNQMNNFNSNNMSNMNKQMNIPMQTPYNNTYINEQQQNFHRQETRNNTYNHPIDSESLFKEDFTAMFLGGSNNNSNPHKSNSTNNLLNLSQKEKLHMHQLQKRQIEIQMQMENGFIGLNPNLNMNQMMNNQMNMGNQMNNMGNQMNMNNLYGQRSQKKVNTISNLPSMSNNVLFGSNMGGMNNFNNFNNMRNGHKMNTAPNFQNMQNLNQNLSRQQIPNLNFQNQQGGYFIPPNNFNNNFAQNNQFNPFYQEEEEEPQMPNLLENPIYIVQKNLTQRGWFLTTDNNKILGNFNSIELINILEDKMREDHLDNLNNIFITDYDTDIYFTPSNLYEILRENLPKILNDMKRMKTDMGKNSNFNNNNSNKNNFNPNFNNNSSSRYPNQNQFGPNPNSNQFSPNMNINLQLVKNKYKPE